MFRDDCRVKGSLVEDDIDPYWANLVPGVQAYEATMHFMGNQYVDLEPGADAGLRRDVRGGVPHGGRGQRA